MTRENSNNASLLFSLSRVYPRSSSSSSRFRCAFPRLLIVQSVPSLMCVSIKTQGEFVVTKRAQNSKFKENEKRPKKKVKLNWPSQDVFLSASLLYQNNRTFTRQQLFALILRAKRYAHQSWVRRGRIIHREKNTEEEPVSGWTL